MPQKITIIDYGLGNIGSIVNLLTKVNSDWIVTKNYKVIENSKKIIIPGVGSFDVGMNNLTKMNLIKPLNMARKKNANILGICLGMQLMGEKSKEGRQKGLGWLSFQNIKFENNNSKPIIVPHIGWKTIKKINDHPILNNINKTDKFYFIHSFHASNINSDEYLATANYIYDFPSVVGKGNLIGVQFHPEKSHRAGIKLIQNFINL